MLHTGIFVFDWTAIRAPTDFGWMIVIAEVALACLLLSSQSAGTSISHSRENIATQSMIDDSSQVTRTELFIAARAISAGRLFLAALWPLAFIGVLTLMARF